MTIRRLCEIKSNGKVVLKRNVHHYEETISSYSKDVILDNLKRDDVRTALDGRKPNGETYGKTEIYIITEAEWNKLVELNKQNKNE